MSREAMTWVLEEAPDMPPHLLGVAMGLANHAGRDGRGAYPRQDRLAWYARKSDRAVRNDLTALADLGLIRPGDPSLVAHMPADERPTVWDLAVERKRDPYPRERKPTSGRGGASEPHEGRKSTSGASDDSTGSEVPGGSAVPAGSTVPRERKPTSEPSGSPLPTNHSLNRPEPKDPCANAQETLVLADVPAPTNGRSKSSSKRRKKINRTEYDDQADELTNGFWDRYSGTTAQTWIAVRQVVLTALGNGVERDVLAFALDAVGKDRQPVTRNILTMALRDLHKANGQRTSSGSGVDRRQQSTNDLFDRALARARARDQEAS